MTRRLDQLGEVVRAARLALVGDELRMDGRPVARLVPELGPADRMAMAELIDGLDELVDELDELDAVDDGGEPLDAGAADAA